jgi:hypothetical protein
MTIVVAAPPAALAHAALTAHAAHAALTALSGPA